MVTGGPSLQARTLLNGEQAEGTMSLTQSLTDLGAWYVGLFAHEASAVTDDGKGHGTSSRRAQELVLAPRLASSAPLTATQTSDSFGFLAVTVRTVPVQLISENCEQRRSLWKCLVNVQTQQCSSGQASCGLGRCVSPRMARWAGGEVYGQRGRQFLNPQDHRPSSAHVGCN